MPVERTCPNGQAKRSVRLNLPREQLVYRVILEDGPQANFLLSDTQKRVLLTSAGQPPSDEYVRVWPSEAGDLPNGQESISHILNLRFSNTAPKYRYVVEKREVESDELVKTVKDCTYTGDAGESRFERLRVRLQGGEQ